MRAELRDPSPEDDRNFFIDPTGKRVQRVDLQNSEATTWNWTVKPLQKGTHQLKIIIEIIFEKDGKDIPKEEEQIFEVSVVVEPNFFSQNLLMLIIGGFVLILATVAYFLIKRRKTQKAVQLALPYEELVKLIGLNQLESALDLLTDAFEGKSDKYANETLLYRSRLLENQEKERLGIIDDEKATLEKNKINFSVLKMLKKVKKEFNID